MTTPLSEFFPKFKKLHGIYVMRRTFEGTCAFLTGYEVGSDHHVLKEFHGWLVPRGKGRPELYWPHLVLCEIYPDGALPEIRYFTPEQDEQAVAMLFNLLDEFFETSDQHRSKVDQPLRIKLQTDERTACTMMFEPMGVTWDLGPDEHMYAEVQSMKKQEMEVVVWPGGISLWPPGPIRVFDASGQELGELNY